MSDKIKIYKNPLRDTTEKYQPYIPQYQIKGVEPEPFAGGKITPGSPNVSKPPIIDDQRSRRPITNQPYAEVSTSPLGVGKGLVPNVGNNMEHAWSSVDGEIVDDISEQIDPNYKMIDNNNFINEPAQNNFSPAIEEQIPQELFSIVGGLKTNEYLLLVNNSAVCSGPLEEIEEQVRLLVFGEHEAFDVISPDEISVIKKIGLKIGVFLQ